MNENDDKLQTVRFQHYHIPLPGFGLIVSCWFVDRYFCSYHDSVFDVLSRSPLCCQYTNVEHDINHTMRTKHASWNSNSRQQRVLGDRVADSRSTQEGNDRLVCREVIERYRQAKPKPTVVAYFPTL